MAGIKDPRQLAVVTLNELDQSEDFLRDVLDEQIRRNDLSRVNQGLFTELVYGTVRMRANLDHVLAQFSSRPLSKIEPAVLNILRLAVYQILYLERVPDRAAVHEAVKLARKFSHEGSAKFCNGVLRSVLRGRSGISYPSLEQDPAGHLSLKYSYPRWLVEHWLQWWGREEALALAQAMNEPPTLHIRINTLKTTVEEARVYLQGRGVEVRAGQYAPEVLQVQPAHLVVGDPWLQEGKYYIQDESSALAAHALQVQPGQVVYDLCSAPGGKSTHLAQLMENQGRILALDQSPRRLRLVEENARRLGISIIETLAADAREALALEPAPRVLVDAPCSGLGTMRHRPDIRWRKNLQEIRELVEIQKAILGNAARHVAPGGLLLYTTCTITKWENEEVAQWFLANHPDFSGHSFPLWFPQSREAWLTLLPHRHQVDGFFLAIFRKHKS